MPTSRIRCFKKGRIVCHWHSSILARSSLSEVCLDVVIPVDLVQQLLFKCFSFWLEVLSLTGTVDRAELAVRILATRIQVCSGS